MAPFYYKGKRSANRAANDFAIFQHMLESFLSDSVMILVNRKDGPLTMSQYMNMKYRMGRVGPSNLSELPGSVLVWDITGIISWADLPAMGHDYLLRNKELRDYLINRVVNKYQAEPKFDTELSH